ncbi:MAG: hypothetical protein JWO91_2096 [Acidobacteriaceae bacterium]|nr:hypothetical protein [Acidobacteriaceae bacterium]
MIGDSDEEPAVFFLRKALLQFVPRNGELPLGTLVLKAIEPNVLDENIQAMNKAARGRVPTLSCCGRSRNTGAPKLSTALA